MNAIITGKFFSGTSNIVLPVKNKSQFPAVFQDKSRLEYYASLFNTVEINSTFYKLPMASTIAKWAESVPKNFRFTFKLWKEITHVKDLAFKPEDVDRFMQSINQAGSKKGCLLVQFPPSLTIARKLELEQLLTAVSKNNAKQEWRIAVEFRHKSWYQPEIYDLIDHFNASLVLHDKPSSATPFLKNESSFVYIRFHGPDGSYRGSYTNYFLQEYAQYIKDWQQEGKIVYAYFNNTMGDAVKNLMTLNELVGEK